MTDFRSPPPSCESTSLAYYSKGSNHVSTYLVLILQLALEACIGVLSTTQGLKHSDVLGHRVALLRANCFLALRASSLTAVYVFSRVPSFLEDLGRELGLWPEVLIVGHHPLSAGAHYEII